MGVKGAIVLRKSEKSEEASYARSHPICPSLLELQAFLTSSLTRVGCDSPGVAKDGRCDRAWIGSSTEVDAAPTPSARSDAVVVCPDLISRNKSPKASFPLVTVVLTIVSSKPALDARTGAEVGRAPDSRALSCCACDVTAVGVAWKCGPRSWPADEAS
jgi:hypothetical protein